MDLNRWERGTWCTFLMNVNTPSQTTRQHPMPHLLLLASRISITFCLCISNFSILLAGREPSLRGFPLNAAWAFRIWFSSPASPSKVAVARSRASLTKKKEVEEERNKQRRWISLNMPRRHLAGGGDGNHDHPRDHKTDDYMSLYRIGT